MLIKLGTIIKLGDHTLVCGDSTQAGLYKLALTDTKINTVVTDPPYGVAVVENAINKSGQHKKIANDQLQTDSQYQLFTEQWLGCVVPYLSEYNGVYIFNSDKMLFALKQAMDSQKVKFAQLLIWVKNQPVIGRLDYLPMHELIAYGWYGKHKFHKSKDKSVLFYPKPKKSKYHPTTKPLGLIRNIILNSTELGEVVCDPFLGSGTTLLACEQTKRKCIGFELDPEYCQLIVKRWQKTNSGKAEVIREGV